MPTAVRTRASTRVRLTGGSTRTTVDARTAPARRRHVVVSTPTGARHSPDRYPTRATVLARVSSTSPIYVAVAFRFAWRTSAEVTVDQVDACGDKRARVTRAFVRVEFARGATESGRAYTRERVVDIAYARASIQTGRAVDKYINQ